MTASIRILTKTNDERISTFFINNKWMTFYRFGGRPVELLEATTFYGASQNHLEFLKRIYKGKINEQSESVQNGNQKSTEKTAEETSSGFQGLEETSKVNGIEPTNAKPQTS